MFRNTMGFIKLRRDFQEWEWYGKPLMVAFWIHLLINANSIDKEWRGEQVRRGQLITSLSGLSLDTGLSVKQVRIALSRLEKGKTIIVTGSNKQIKITICDYNSYMPLDDSGVQAEERRDDKQMVEEVQSAAKQPVMIEEHKEEEEIKTKKKKYPEYVEKLYQLYPSSTIRPNGNKATLKSASKDKNKIHTLIRNGDYTKEYLEYAIKKYVSEANAPYLKAFQTFLNQVPDYSTPSSGQLFTQEKSSAQPAPTRSNRTVTISELRNFYKPNNCPEDQWQRDLQMIIQAKQRDGITVIDDEK